MRAWGGCTDMQSRARAHQCHRRQSASEPRQSRRTMEAQMHTCGSIIGHRRRASPTACLSRGYARAGTQNDRLGESFSDGANTKRATACPHACLRALLSMSMCTHRWHRRRSATRRASRVERWRRCARRCNRWRHSWAITK